MVGVCQVLQLCVQLQHIWCEGRTRNTRLQIAMHSTSAHVHIICLRLQRLACDAMHLGDLGFE